MMVSIMFLGSSHELVIWILVQTLSNLFKLAIPRPKIVNKFRIKPVSKPRFNCDRFTKTIWLENSLIIYSIFLKERCLWMETVKVHFIIQLYLSGSFSQNKNHFSWEIGGKGYKHMKCQETNLKQWFSAFSQAREMCKESVSKI